jgi:hypothetical protein
VRGIAANFAKLLDPGPRHRHCFPTVGLSAPPTFVATILLGFALHCWCFRILDLQQQSLAHDAA